MPTAPLRRATQWLAALWACGGGIATVALAQFGILELENVLESRPVERPQVVVETKGDEFIGRLVSIDPQQGVVLQDDSFAHLQPDEVLTVRLEQRQPATGAEPIAGEALLVDGSRFEYVDASFEDDRAKFTLRGGVRHQAPVASIALLRLRSAGDSEPVPDGGAADVLLVKRRDGGFTPVEGVVVELNATGVRFALDADGASEPVNAPWARVGGLRFYRGDAKRDEAPGAVISLSDGGRVVAETVSYSGLFNWSGADGSAGAAATDAVAAVDLSAGRVVPVSRLEMTHNDWRPYFAASEDESGYSFNASFEGAPLALRFPDRRAPSGWPAVSDKRQFEQGVALRSRGELRFVLPEGATCLRGWLGLDPATARSGSASVSIVAGEKTLWSGEVDGDTRPVELNAPLAGAKTLTLRVDYGDNLDTGDHLHFADLRVIR